MDDAVRHVETLGVIAPLDGKALDNIKEAKVMVRKWKQDQTRVVNDATQSLHSGADGDAKGVEKVTGGCKVRITSFHILSLIDHSEDLRRGLGRRG
jgi:hypothetical protein